MSATFKSLGEKLNEACFLFVNGEAYCTLCDVKLPSKSNYDSHMKGKTHRVKSNNVFKQLMTSVLSPGIVIQENDADVDIIYCFLCEQQVSKLFDVSFHNHINSCNHTSRANQQMKTQKAKKFDAFCRRQFDGPQDVLLRGVSRAAIIMVDGGYRCVACDRGLTKWSHLLSHIKESSHQEWVFDQLIKVSEKVGLSLGVIIKDGSLVCKLCNCQFGNGLATAEAYFHAHGTSEDDKHKKKVEEQIKDGVNEYLKGEKISDELDFFTPPNNMLGRFNDSVYARLSLYNWRDHESNEEIFMMHASLGRASVWALFRQ